MNGLGLMIVCALSCCPDLGAQTWTGAIVKQGDTVVVKNPKIPMIPAASVRFHEEISIRGGSLPPEAAFGSIRDVAVAADGRIYVAEIKQGKVLAFDAHGKFLFAFGKRGQGPGEFSNPIQISIRNARREVFVDAPRKGVVFDLDGRFKENTIYPSAMLTVRSDEQGALVGMVRDTNEPKGSYQLVKTGGVGSAPIVLAEAPLPDLNAPDPFMPRLAWDLRPDGFVAEGLPEKYEIQIQDVAGMIIRRISREYDPVPVTARDEEEYLKTVPPEVAASTGRPRFSNRFPAFRRIVADERGWLFVETNEKTPGGKSLITDIFDSDGRYVARFGEGGTIFRVCGGKIYAVVEDEEGEIILKRYMMEWKK